MSTRILTAGLTWWCLSAGFVILWFGGVESLENRPDRRPEAVPRGLPADRDRAGPFGVAPPDAGPRGDGRRISYTSLDEHDVSYETMAVIVGGNINGLSSVRELGLAGITVYLVTDREHGQPAVFSRFVSKVCCEPQLYRDPALVVPLVEALAKELGHKPVVYTGSDLYLNEIGRARSRLIESCHLPFPGDDVISLIGDKTSFYRFAREHEIPIAPTAFVTSEDELEAAITSLRFPMVLKASEATLAWRRHGWKVMALRDHVEAREKGSEALSVHDDLVIQEVVPGDDSSLHFFFGYLDERGVPLAEFTGRKLRQNVPKFGISSLAESTHAPEVARRSDGGFPGRLDRTWKAGVDWSCLTGEAQMAIVLGARPGRSSATTTSSTRCERRTSGSRSYSSSEPDDPALTVASLALIPSTGLAPVPWTGTDLGLKRSAATVSSRS